MYENIDRSDMLGLLIDFPNQCRIAKEIGSRFNPPGKRRKYKMVLWCGMGGSAIGGDVVASCIKDRLKIPMIVNRHYNIPACCDKDTLVVISSYSGNTEETISCYKQARAKKAEILIITSGGKLEESAVREGRMLIVIPQGLPPRCALGYSSIPALIALSRLGLITLKPGEIDEAIRVIETLRKRLSPFVGAKSNVAKKLARSLNGRFPVIFGSTDRFEPVVYRWRTQIAENAKLLSSHHFFAELNHNEIEGFEPYSKLPKKIVVIMLKDKLDHPRIKRRMVITKDIIKGKGPKVIDVSSSGRGVLARVFSVIYIGDWMSFYLAVMNKVDPTPVDRITYLKKRLAKA